MENIDYVNRFKNVTVLGAAGKMGSGILLLTAWEMVALMRNPENEGREFTLNAMDISDETLQGVLGYLKKQTQKIGEKKIDKVKALYAGLPDLGSDEEIVSQYVADVMSVVKSTTSLETAYNSTLIFEAVSEDQSLKVKLLGDIAKNNPNNPWFLTNTSSVPIHELDDMAGLNGKIIGFHFYNPPAIQKLVEVIVAEKTESELAAFADHLLSKLGKIKVPSNDKAGFIGNGHFMRDSLFGIELAEKLAVKHSFPCAVYMINTISQKFLIRPMGIFQLIDYVGVDVVQLIMKVMNPHFPSEKLHSSLLDELNEAGVKGGQNPDGSQKNGFLQYEEGRITGVYNPAANNYTPVQEIKSDMDEVLGPFPEGMIPWKDLIRDPEKENKISAIFKAMRLRGTKGSELAMEYGLRSKEIGLQLVADGIAHSQQDVNTVLLTGFFHLYGPINDYF